MSLLMVLLGDYIADDEMYGGGRYRLQLRTLGSANRIPDYEHIAFYGTYLVPRARGQTFLGDDETAEELLRRVRAWLRDIGAQRVGRGSRRD